MALKDAIILTPFPEDELETRIKKWVREVLEENQTLQEIPHQQDEKPLTIKEASEFFGKSRQTIYDWMRKGYLPFHKISNRTYFLRSELIQAMTKIQLDK